MSDNLIFVEDSFNCYRCKQEITEISIRKKTGLPYKSCEPCRKSLKEYNDEYYKVTKKRKGDNEPPKLGDEKISLDFLSFVPRNIDELLKFYR